MDVQPVLLIPGYPGQSSPNLLQDNSGKQVPIRKKKACHSMTAKRKTNIITLKNRLNYGVLNARSINNKTDAVVDFILEHELDILGITETWLQADDNFTANSVVPSGYSIISNPRLNKRGGGVAAIVKNDLCCKRLASVQFTTFEALLVTITSSSKSLAI